MANLLKDVILSDDAKLNWRQRFRRRTIKLSNKFSHALSRQSTKLRKSLSKAVDWNDPNSYLKRLSSFGLVGTEGLVEPEDPTLPRSFSRTMSRTLSRGASFGRSLSRQLSATTLAAAHHVSTKCWIIVHSKMFRFAVLFFISLNMAGLCSLKAKMTHQHESSIQSLEISMIIIFAAELVVRFLAAGLAGFIDERMNVIDLLVVFVSCGATGPKRKYPNLTPIRMLRWFYVKKSRRIDKEGQGTPILASILRSVGALSSVYFFLLMVIIIFSVFSMELYGGQMYNFDDGYPRANHDSFLQTMLLWFSVTTGESWVNHMWNAMRPGVKNRWFAPFLFVLYYMITAYVILNLIIATILEETELTDNQKKHIQKREHLKWLQTKHLQHMSSTRGSDWLLATVSGAHKGYKDVKRRMTSMRVSRMSLFPSRQTSEFQGSPPQTTAEGTSSSAESRPPAAVTPTEASSSRTFPPSRGLSTKRASFTTSDLPGSTDADDRTKARIFRRSSASALSTIAPATVHTPLHRRMSQESDKVLQRSGFTGGDFGGENRTVLQAALLAVVDDQAKVAAASVARDADEKIKAKAIAAGTGMYGRTKSGRTSFVLSDFEGIEAAEEKQDPWWMNRRSLFLFVPNNKMRLFITKVVDHPWYRWWQVLFCGCGTFVMASTDSIGNYYFFGPALPTLDKLTMAVFTLDVVLKSIAYGFLFTREAYLGDPYNFIDLLNLVMHGMYLTKYRHELPKNVFNKGKQIWLRTWRIMLAFRPFRFISRFRGLRTLTTSLIHTMPAIGQIFLFTVIVYAIYAVIGMQLYANRFRFCTDTTVIGHVDCVGLYHNEVGILMSRTWVNAPFHFDAFGEAMLALFVASTSDNWLEYFLYTSMDLAHHPELSPRRNISPSHALYFVSFICIGGFFILRMFVGVFIDQFGIISGTKLLTERQKLWRDTNRLIQSLRPKRLPAEVHGPIRGTCHNIVHSRAFELGVVAVICGNYIYIATVHYRQSLTLDQHNAIETAFVSVYLMEAILKFIGTKTADWWDDKWNVSELIMVLVSATVLWPTRYPKHVLSMHKVAGFFIIVRIFRVIRYFHTLNTMVKTVLVSLPSMVNIISLMGIFLACLAQVAQQTFPAIRDGICIHSRGENSFEDFAASFIVLLQVTTLDNWSCIMIDITIQPPDCVPGLSTVENDCGYPVGGLVYMLIAVCLTNYIFANLFIAQILDSITFGLLSENALLTPANLIAYQNLWSQKAFDSKCTGYLGQHKLKEFLVKLGSPLGGRKLIGFVKWYTKIEFEVFHFRSDKGIAFQPLLETICLYKVGPRGLELPIRIERERQIKSIYEKGAAIKIQGLVRGFLQRRRNKRAKAGGMEKDEGGKRYSENPDKPPDIVFGEDPLQARSGVARPHPRSQPLPTETGTPSNDGDRTPEQSSTSHASKPHESPSHSEIVPEIVPDTP